MIINNSVYTEINISDIIYDEFFKVSKKNYSASLSASLKQSGMLEVPYLIKTESGYSIFTCHNRIKILQESGIPYLKCFVLSEPDSAVFMDHVSLKVFRNESGPSGKIKTLTLLNSFFKLDQQLIKNFCTKILKLPHDILENEAYMNKVLSFPDTLINYLDEKDLSFKIIKDLSSLSDDWIAVIDKWIKDIPVRVNIFRMIVDHIFDIYRRGDNLSVLKSIECSDDKTLYDSIFKIRHPEFSKLKTKSDGLINELSGTGLTIEFPEYLDRSFVTLKLDISKKSDCTESLKKISKINVEKLKELLSML